MSAAALQYLAVRSASNRARGLAARLKDPRYLVALLVGGAYFVWIFGTLLLERDVRADAGPPAWLLPLAPLPLLLVVLIWWFLGRSSDALAFSPAEAHFLFAAPLGRRQIVRYKLARRQLGVAFTVALVSLNLWVVGGGALGGGGLFSLLLSLWILFTTLQLHQVGASLVHAAAADQGRAGLGRHWPAIVVLAAVVTAVVAALWRAGPEVAGASSLSAAAEAVAAALGAPAARAALLPFRLLLAPVLATDGGAWVRALPGAALVLWLHYLWVIRSDAAFEEGAAEAGRRRAERLLARSAGRSTGVGLAALRRLPAPPFRLAPTGAPAVALLWKNLTLATRTFRPQTAALFAFVFAGAFLLMRAAGDDPRQAAIVCAAMAFAVAALTTVAGPVAVRNDLRTDLQNVELLRTYPLKGRELVAAEVAASTALLTAAQMLFLAVGLGFLLAGFPSADPWWAPGAGVVAALLVLPPVNAMLLGAQNGLALLFPAWARIGSGHPGGVEQTGLFMLTVAGGVLFLAVTLVGPAAVASGVHVAVRWAVGGPGVSAPPWVGVTWWAALPAAVAGWGTLVAELALLIRWLGDRYDALDPAEAGLLE